MAEARPQTLNPKTHALKALKALKTPEALIKTALKTLKVP